MGRPASHDWPSVLQVALSVLQEEGPMPRPELWALLLERGAVRPHGVDGFRAAVLAAQQRGEFPPLPHARTGPARGTAWTDDRHAAQQILQDQPTPYELFTTREAECRTLLRDLAAVRTVKLSPRSFAILAAVGYGDFMVRRAVLALVHAGLAEVRYERSGLDAVPCVRAA